MKKTPYILLGLLFLIVLLYDSLFIVNQIQQAVVLQFGEPVSIISTPGLKMKVPFIQNVLLFDKRIQNLSSATSEVIALDQKTMRVDSFIKYKIEDPLVFFEATQNESKFKPTLSTILDSSLRQVLGSYPFKTLLTSERSFIMAKIKEIVDKEAASFGVGIVDVRISRADLPDKSREAVYLRMKTGIEKEAREIRANGSSEAQKIIATADKEKTIILAEARQSAQTIRGEGDSEGLRTFAEAVSRDPEFFEFYRTMELYKNTMTKDSTYMVLSEDNKLLKYMQSQGIE